MMKARYATITAVVLIGFGLAYTRTELIAPAVAGDEVIAAAVASTVPALGGEYEYVGSSKCKKCHIKQHRSWKKTKLASALETLKPGEASEAKQKFNLDPAKDYSNDEKCVGCHTTGHGKPGGFFIADPGDEKAVKKANKLADVGCEACHGPGSAYIEVFEEIQKSKRKYKVEELYAVGLTKIDAATCTECHNEKSPTHDPSDPFDFDKKKEETHDHIPLEQREE